MGAGTLTRGTTIMEQAVPRTTPLIPLYERDGITPRRRAEIEADINACRVWKLDEFADRAQAELDAVTTCR